MTYDACLVATGGAPRRLPIDGADLDGVLLLRSWQDARDVVKHAGDAERVVVVGASFIGMEAASSLSSRGVEVTVVGKEDVPFAAAMGEEVGRVFQRAAEAKGVAFRLGVEVDRIETAHAEQVDGPPHGLRVVVGGASIECDVVVMGVGVSPATDFLDGASFRRDDGGLVTDAALRVAPALFAAGDVAAFPDARLGRTVRIEHWRLAQQHARTAALNMLAESDPTVADVPFDGVPFFWTGQFGLSLRYVGHAPVWDEVVVDGSLDDAEFLAGYVEGGAVRAVAAVGRDRDAAAFHLLLAQGRPPTPDDLRAGVDLQARL